MTHPAPPDDAILGLKTIRGGGGKILTYQKLDGRGPTRVWLPGFMADMTGTKAAYLAAQAAARKTGFLRFDYSGCGRSEGRFEDGSIGVWLADALAMLDGPAAQEPVVLVGSSMGGWIALLATLARPAQVKGLVLIAPAPDFTERLMWPSLPETARAEIMEKGVHLRASAYGDGPYAVTRTLIEDGRNHLVLGAPIPFAGPVRILHGQQDPDVPWRLSLELAERLTGDDVRVTLVKAGDHRLSTPADLALLDATVEEVAAGVALG